MTPELDRSSSSAPGPAASAVAAHLRRVVAQESAPWLHAEVARRMVDRLQWIKLNPAVVLDWWGVQGGGRALLQAHYPKARIEAVEPTDALVARAGRDAQAPWWSRWRREPPVIWPEAAAPKDARAQMVWANMMLHWADDPAEVFARWRTALAVDGFVMFSCFGPDTLRQLRRLYAAQGWGPVSHGFIDMHDLGDALVGAGFADPVMDMETLTLTWADAASMLGELRSLGGNAAKGRADGLRSRAQQARWHRAVHEALVDEQGRLALDFEIVYGHAFQPAPRLAMGQEIRVSAVELQAMARKGRPRAGDA